MNASLEKLRSNTTTTYCVITSNKRKVVSLPCRHDSVFFFPFITFTIYSSRQSHAYMPTLFLVSRPKLFVCQTSSKRKMYTNSWNILEWKCRRLSLAWETILSPWCASVVYQIKWDALLIVTCKQDSPYKLYWNGFLATSKYFSQGVDHPSFYFLLKTCQNFRVKPYLQSFHHYRTLLEPILPNYKLTNPKLLNRARLIKSKSFSLNWLNASFSENAS